MKEKMQRRLFIILFLVPTLIAFVLFYVYPLITVFVTTLCKWDYQNLNAPELLPLAIVRMFSASAATGLALDVFKEYGTDSYVGLAASIMMGCTETVFYTMSIYFMTAKVKKTRYTLPGALLATVAGIAVSVWLAGKMVLNG